MSITNSKAGTAVSVATMFKPKTVAIDEGKRIVNLLDKTRKDAEAVERAVDTFNRSKHDMIATVTIGIYNLAFADPRVRDMLSYSVGGDTGQVSALLDTLRTGLGFGNIVTGESGHKRFDLNDLGKKAFDPGNAKEGSPAWQRAKDNQKNFGRLLKAGAQTVLSMFEHNMVPSYDEASRTLRLTGGDTEKVFGKSEILLGSAREPIVEGKSKPSFLALQDMAKEGTPVEGNKGKTTATSAPTATGVAPSADPQENVRGICNMLITAIARAKGMGPLSTDTIRSLSNAREAISDVLPTVIKAGTDEHAAVAAKAPAKAEAPKAKGKAKAA